MESAERRWPVHAGSFFILDDMVETIYVSPDMEVVKVEVELGFGTSSGSENSGMETPGWGSI